MLLKCIYILKLTVAVWKTRQRSVKGMPNRPACFCQLLSNAHMKSWILAQCHLLLCFCYNLLYFCLNVVECCFMENLSLHFFISMLKMPVSKLCLLPMVLFTEIFMLSKRGLRYWGSLLTFFIYSFNCCLSMGDLLGFEHLFAFGCIIFSTWLCHDMFTVVEDVFRSFT